MTRTLPVVLEQYLNEKMGLKHAEENDANDPTRFLILTAMACIGIKEEGAPNCGKMVEAFQHVITKPVSQPWCVDFIQGVIAYVEETLKVVSPVPATELCVELFEHDCEDSGDVGKIVVWKTQGGHHCGLIVGQDKTKWITIEGNTGPIGFKRDGDGVYVKYRLKGGALNFKEIGFLTVFPCS